MGTRLLQMIVGNHCRSLIAALSGTAIVGMAAFLLACPQNLSDFLNRDEFYTLCYSAEGCGSLDCSPHSAAYPHGTILVLTPKPDADYAFGEWSGPNGSEVYLEGGQWKILMDEDKTVIGTFIAKPRYTLVLTTVGAGTAAASPSAPTYVMGTVVTLVATPDPAFYFGGWSGPNGPEVYLEGGEWKILMDGNKEVAATFTAVPTYTLSLTTDSGTGDGTVTANPPGWIYAEGTVVTLTPTPDGDSVFESWAGTHGSDVTADGAAWKITIDENKTVAAVFRFAANADLSALTVSTGTLSPAFSAAATAYAVDVPNSVVSITVTGTSADDEATMSANNGVSQGLDVGDTTITITVTAPNGTTVKNYAITVRRFSFTNLGIIFNDVSSGTFQRDATATNTSTVSAFKMGRYEVTRAQFTAVMGFDPATSFSSGVNDPVHSVRWIEAVEYCNRLSVAEGLTPAYTITGRTPAIGYPITAATVADPDWGASGYRLPTEMEWMWAAMGATGGATGYTKPFAGSDGANAVGDYAVFGSGAPGATTSSRTNPVGSKLPNELSIYDMSGNVWEMCWDWSADYPVGPVTDYRGPASGTMRIRRGGGWSGDVWGCSMECRNSYNPVSLYNDIGFRVVRR